MCAYGFWLTFVSGARGFIAIDQSHVFDGAWRVLCGQIPYLDFLTPHGPVAVTLQAAVFGLLGVGYRSYLLAAAAVNSIAVLLAALLVWRVAPGAWAGASVAGLVTASYFYPHAGTTYFENTAFLFALLALAAVWPLVLGSPLAAGSRRLLLALAGAACLLALLSKLNAGATFLVALVAILACLRPWSGRRLVGDLLWLGGGLGLGAAAFGLWLVLASDPAAFWRHVFEIPLESFGARQASRSWLVGVAFGQIGPVPRHALIGAAGIALASGLGCLFAPRIDSPLRVPVPLAGAVVVSLVLAQNVFSWTTWNEAENNQPFLGLVLGILVVLAGGRLRAAGGRLSTLALGSARIGLLALGVWLAWDGLTRARARTFHNIFGLSEFGQPLAHPRLSPLRWGEPTLIDKWHFREADLLALIDLLESEGEPFFVFPDHTLLYGVVGVPSPQPLHWFHRGITYSATYDESLDRRIVESLERAGITRVVLESGSFFNTSYRLAQFPKLQQWIVGRFAPAERIGAFRVWRRRR